MEGNNREEIVDVGSVVEAVSADDGDAPLYNLESLCMRCGQNGITRFLLTLIPHFRKILLSAFECSHCGERNNEVQFAGEIQPRGCCYSLEIPSGEQKMLNRQVVKSESATIKIPELDFEIPPEAQRGSLSTVEGILMRAADELQALQEERRKVAPETAEAIDQFLVKLRACATGESSFMFILDDPAGNSFIENQFAPSSDPYLTIKFYERTPEQQTSLGYLVDSTQIEGTTDEVPEGGEAVAANQMRGEPHGSVGAAAGHQAIAQSNSAEIAEALFRYTAPEEVMTFPSTCGGCASPCETRMFLKFEALAIPLLKPGGRIPEKGKRITLSVKNVNDLSRDVIKSDTASVKVPELDLELASGTLGGIVTTVEGLERVHGFTFGDSLDEHRRSKWLDFKASLKKLLSLEEAWTLTLDDALANSFVAPATDDLKDDNQLTCLKVKV
ncbi:Zinc finger, ZPR1-type [Sesbania bispinosa]|nr:Zinc finger, ZPR1-type [Sesbania bispinosa]